MSIEFKNWTRERAVVSLGTNDGSDELPFQNWRPFKEAYTPELVYRAVRESDRKVAVCLDPFGGSGTTALACQFLGVYPETIEVNPYLADLIEAKLHSYDIDSLAKDFGRLLKAARSADISFNHLCDELPATFIEPGVEGRYLFSLDLAGAISGLITGIKSVENSANARLFRVLLGRVCVACCNAVISGKGRRYKKNWETRQSSPAELKNKFSDAVVTAIADIRRHARRPELDYKLHRGDSRILAGNGGKIDLAVFSPPYPNSFDYTDVYNIELWMLGYFFRSEQNRSLRQATLSSHVQIKRDFAEPPANSDILSTALSRLDDVRSQLWNRNIPDMVGGYFADMTQILSGVSDRLKKGGKVFAVVGDSRYSGIQIPTAAILDELSNSIGFKTEHCEPFRSMRSSPQQGGTKGLDETLIVLQKL